ncbi:MAG TPA: DNA cytosine methyltransferase, partial [Chloroflexota bacterium]
MALCAGAGGLELGLRIALGDDYRSVVYVEREAYAAATLVARMADAALDHAPVWDDLTTFDGNGWRGVVDLVSAGFSCQPWSPAGKRLGIADERWLWPDIHRIVCEVGPDWVFLENVPGLVHGGLEHVLRDLAASGFDAEWDCLSAAEVGASQLRQRLYILARATRGGLRVG